MANENIDINQKPKNILGQLIKQGLTPMQDNTLKAVLKKRAEQASEAMDQGVPAEEILKSEGIALSEGEAVKQISDPNNPTQLVGDERNQINQSFINSQSNDINQFAQKAQDIALKDRSLLEKILMPIIGDAGGRMRERKLGNIEKAQKIAGKEPLQEKDKEKLAIQLQNDIDKIQVKDMLDSINNLDKAGSLDANDLFGKFEPIAQAFEKDVNFFSRLEELSKGEPSGASDIGIIFSYMKMLDRDSAVREGEQATVRNASNVPDRIKNLYNRMIVSGESLNPKQRDDIVNSARKAFGENEKTFINARKGFDILAKKNDIDSERFLRDPRALREQNKLQEEISNMSDEELQAIAGGK